MHEVTLNRARHGLGVRVLMTLMLLGLATFIGTMAVLVSHDSALVCEPGARCRHVERYPFGVVSEHAVAPIERADVKWDTGGRAAALKVVLQHLDGTKTEYQGVGKNGERAEDTAAAINAYLARSEGAQTFALREGSLPVAVFMALLALTSLVLVPYFFSRVRVVRSPEATEITVERWPAPPARLSVQRGAATRVVIIERIVNGQQFFTLFLAREGAPNFDLGLAARTAERAEQARDVVDAALR
jgi:DNA-binding transcriptional regulator YdaS (Cro superfamily)